MLSDEIRAQIRNIIKEEVLPAVGCTEPIAVALAVSKAVELLGKIPERIVVRLSGNIIKNAMGVGIPGTGMIGLPIAIALGVVAGKSSYGLEVLKDVDDEAVACARQYVDEGRIVIEHLEDVPSNLYIMAIVSDNERNEATAIIAYRHDNFIMLKKNGTTVWENDCNNDKEAQNSNSVPLSLRIVWDYATLSPLEELEFIIEAKTLNVNAAKVALNNNGAGHKVGKIILNNSSDMFGDSHLSYMLAMTSGACDARMAGEQVTVMSNSGSGNQGIAITMPVVAYCERVNASYEKEIRALILAHLTSIYIKQSLGRLSALCGCVVASTGAALAIVYLMDGSYEQGTYSVKNMIATLTGMICDGAKPACSLKIASGVSTAYIASLMALNNQCVSSTEGIINESVDETIRNFSLIGREAMLETDRVVLDIMTKS